MLRKLALRLALLSNEDRNWLLDHLSISDKERIVRLIDEAVELGLTSDPTLFEMIPVISQPTTPKKGFFKKEELECLPLFWQHLISSYQDGTQRAHLPTHLMNSIVNHARVILHAEGA